MQAADKAGRTALHFAAEAAGSEACIEALLQAGAAVDAADKDGSTPMRAALSAGQLAAASKLVEAGSSVLWWDKARSHSTRAASAPLALPDPRCAQGPQRQPPNPKPSRSWLQRLTALRQNPKTRSEPDLKQTPCALQAPFPLAAPSSPRSAPSSLHPPLRYDQPRTCSLEAPSSLQKRFCTRPLCGPALRLL